MSKDNSTLAISQQTLESYLRTAVKESELEISGKRYRNDILFAPPESQDYRDFIEFSDYFGE